MVQQAAVLPAEKNASAAPSCTSSIATWMDERFLSVARETFSAIPTASGGVHDVDGQPVARRARRSSARHDALRAHQRDVDPELAAGGNRPLDDHAGPVVAAEGVHGDARRPDGSRSFVYGQRLCVPRPRPPPTDLLALVEAALRADAVGELGLVAVGAEGQPRGREVSRGRGASRCAAWSDGVWDSA